MESVEMKMAQINSVSSSFMIEANFLKPALDALKNCRRVLMFSYAFAFFLPNTNAKLLFENNQRDLEHATEVLSEILEDELDFDTCDLAELKLKVL